MNEELVLVDTNVILDVLTRDVNWLAWSAEQLHDVMIRQTGAINPLIYTEVSRDYQSREEVDAALNPLSLRRIDLPWEAAFPRLRRSICIADVVG